MTNFLLLSSGRTVDMGVSNLYKLSESGDTVYNELALLSYANLSFFT